MARNPTAAADGDPVEPDLDDFPAAKPKKKPAVRITGKAAPWRADRAPHFRSGGWVKGATSNKGGLHRSLGVPEGENIPPSKISAATHSSDPKVKKEAVLAQTLSRLRK